MAIITARNASGSLSLGGLNLLAGLGSSVLSFTWTDNTSDQADDLSVDIADPDRIWMQSAPKKGASCTAQIIIENWSGPGDTRMIDCGIFWLDLISFKGPPNTVSIKANSIPVTTGIKTQRKFRFFENMPLSGIVAQIAGENGLAPMWDASADPMLKRTDQVDSPDLEYARDKIKEASLSLKIHKGQLIVYSEEEYEARGPAFVLAYGAGNILDFSFSSKLDDTYKKAKTSYVNCEKGELIEGEFAPGEVPEGTGSELITNERIEADSDEAVRKSKSKLREKNKKEKEASIKVVGNPDYISGLNCQLVDFGIFDGKWFISSSTHSISESGYTTDLKLRGALNGY